MFFKHICFYSRYCWYLTCLHILYFWRTSFLNSSVFRYCLLLNTCTGLKKQYVQYIITWLLGTGSFLNFTVNICVLHFSIRMLSLWLWYKFDSDSVLTIGHLFGSVPNINFIKRHVAGRMQRYPTMINMRHANVLK